MQVKSSHKITQQQSYQFVVQRPLRPHSQYSQSVRIPFVTNPTLQPECLITNQHINLGQPTKQIPMMYTRNSYSVSRNPSIGKQNTNVIVMPNSMKVIPFNEIKQQVLRPASNIKR
jgi:hypothetical protein